MEEQHGIKRSTPQPAITVQLLGGDGKKPVTLAELNNHITALLLYLKAQQGAIDSLYDALARRINGMVMYGTAAQRPAATDATLKTGTIYLYTDTPREDYFDGSSWRTA